MAKLTSIIPVFFILISTGCSDYVGMAILFSSLKKSTDSPTAVNPSLSPAPIPTPTVAAITAIDDDSVSISNSATPTITWIHPGLVAGTEGYRFEVTIGSTPGASDIVSWTANGTSTTWSSTGLSLTLNSTYYSSVRITDSAGTVYSTIQGDGWKVVSTVSVAARYSIAPNWNSYARTSSPTTVCDGTENGYFACIHGGEKKRIPYAPATSCTGYTATDELNAFDWDCDDSGGAGNVFFYTYGLKRSKGLADLVTATAWRENRVIIFQAAVPVAASARAAWWTNTVEALPASPTAGSPVMLADSKIYTVSGTMISVGGYFINFNAKEFAVVTLPGGKLMSDPALATNTMLFNGLTYSFFLWFEGDFQGGTTNTYFIDSIGTHSVLRRARLSNFRYGVGNGNEPMNSSWINQVTAAQNLFGGIRIKGSFNTIQDVAAISNFDDGVILGDLTEDNVLINILSANNTSMGIYSYGSDRNTYIAVTSINNTASGIFSSNENYMDYLNVVSKNNNSGYFISNGSNNTYSQSIVESVTLSMSSNLKFTGQFVMTSSALACSASGGTNPGLVNSTCASQGASDHTLQHSVGFGDTSFIGAVNTNDSANSSDVLGVATFNANLDWTHFDNPFRSWGPSGTFLAPAMRGPCSSGTCQIWDFNLALTSTQLRNTTGDAITQNTAFVNGVACPAAVHGNVVTVDRRAAPRTFLTNAVELLGSGGNNNGVCESSESCIYMANFGVDQGSGNFRDKKCNFTNGTVTGVTMYGY